MKKDARTPWLRRLAIIATWVLLGYMGFAASQMHEEFVPDFDPFHILGVNRDDFTDFDSFKKPAKKLYRDLSRTLHPDKKCAEWMKESGLIFLFLELKNFNLNLVKRKMMVKHVPKK